MINVFYRSKIFPCIPHPPTNKYDIQGSRPPSDGHDCYINLYASLTFTVYTVLLTVDIYHIVEFKLLCQRAVFYHTLDLLLV